jgi:hypothetical protein
MLLLVELPLVAQFDANWVTHPQLTGSEQAVVLSVHL